MAQRVMDYCEFEVLPSGDKKMSKYSVLGSVLTIVQNILNLLGSALIVSYLLSAPHCMLREEVGRSHLLSALLAGAGVSSIICAILPSKITVTSGSRLGYLICTFVFLNQQTQLCPGDGDMYAMGQQERTEEWQRRLQIVQGAVIATCLMQIIIGLMGVRILLQVIRPVSIAPTLILLGVFVFKTSAVPMTHQCWNFFSFTCFLMILLYFILDRWFTSKDSMNPYIYVAVRHKLYVGVISVILVWIVCAVCSSFELVWIRSAARTDVFTGVFDYASTWRISYLFQWGIPKWKTEAFFIMLPAAFVCIFEILAHHYISEKRKFDNKIKEMKTDSISRSGTLSLIITLEAIFCLLTSTMGTALGINLVRTKSSQKINGIIVGAALISMALLGRLCALFMTIPEPVMAAFILLFFMLALFEGLNLIQCINMEHANNIFVMGSSLFIGFAVPALIQNETLRRLSGYPLLDDIFANTVRTEFLVGGIVAVILDNFFRALDEHTYAATESRPIIIKNNVKSVSDEEINSNASLGCCACIFPFFD